MNGKVRKFIEEDCSLVINIGALMTDFSSAAFTCNVDPKKMINIKQFEVQFGDGRIVSEVRIHDFLSLILEEVQRRGFANLPQFEVPKEEEQHGLDQACKAHDPEEDRPLLQCCIYPAFEKFFKDGDIIITDTSSSVIGLAACKLPENATFINQTLWGAIGFSTPCAFGAQLAAPDRRVVLITGDGSFQVTAQEVSQMGARGQRPIIFVLNNEGYLIERILCDNANAEYNDIPNWNYSELPHAFNCTGWLGMKASIAKELLECMEKADHHNLNERGGCSGGVLIEVVCGKLDAPDAAWKLYSQIKQVKHELLSEAEK
eukprot:TRINITY_DN18464_c0_g1_i1.p1 TRINITY_DN18464_c0_g1~~TRINITY_DN18464_c0_g1_i1.p1  ORF type:complete len:317 (+),score=86.93 TRINITY_DN18464_c0_g1_i1:1-951(+)